MCVLIFIIGAESMMAENPGAAGTWMGTLEVKHGNSSKADPIELTSTITFN